MNKRIRRLVRVTCAAALTAHGMLCLTAAAHAGVETVTVQLEEARCVS